MSQTTALEPLQRFSNSSFGALKAFRRRARDVWHHSRPSWAGSAFSPSKLGPATLPPEMLEPEDRSRWGKPFVWAGAGVLVLGVAFGYAGSHRRAAEASPEAMKAAVAEIERVPAAGNSTDAVRADAVPTPARQGGAEADSAAMPATPSAMGSLTEYKAIGLTPTSGTALGPAPTLFLDRVEDDPTLPGHEPVSARFMQRAVAATNLARVSD